MKSQKLIQSMYPVRANHSFRFDLGQDCDLCVHTDTVCYGNTKIYGQCNVQAITMLSLRFI